MTAAHMYIHSMLRGAVAQGRIAGWYWWTDPSDGERRYYLNPLGTHTMDEVAEFCDGLMMDGVEPRVRS